MKLIADCIEPPAFAKVCQLFHMACHVPTVHSLQLRVGLLDEDGALVARGTLDGYRQLTFFSQQLKELGYEGRLLDRQAREHGCDVLFAAPSAEPVRYQVGRRIWQLAARGARTSPLWG